MVSGVETFPFLTQHCIYKIPQQPRGVHAGFSPEEAEESVGRVTGYPRAVGRHRPGRTQALPEVPVMPFEPVSGPSLDDRIWRRGLPSEVDYPKQKTLERRLSSFSSAYAMIPAH